MSDSSESLPQKVTHEEQREAFSSDYYLIYKQRFSNSLHDICLEILSISKSLVA